MDHLPPPAFAPRFARRPDSAELEIVASRELSLPPSEDLLNSVYDANRPLSPLTMIALTCALPPSLYHRKASSHGRQLDGVCNPGAAVDVTHDFATAAATATAAHTAHSSTGWDARPQPHGQVPFGSKLETSRGMASGADECTGMGRLAAFTVVEDVYEDYPQTVWAEESSARL